MKLISVISVLSFKVLWFLPYLLLCLQKRSLSTGHHATNHWVFVIDESVDWDDYFNAVIKEANCGISVLRSARPYLPLEVLQNLVQIFECHLRLETLSGETVVRLS